MHTPTAPTIVALDSLAVVRLRGADVLRFLQGQLSNDVERLRHEPSLLAGLHNPQGRTIALMRLVALAPDDVLALLPVELAVEVAARLRRYVLRAKVRIDEETAAWEIEGGWGAPGRNARVVVALADGRFLALREHLATHTARESLADASADPAVRWHRDDIAAGLPQVYRATSEAFVGQMLNLDALDAISFNKGCYTGQEVIARAHYRGRVKRRLQRFRTHAAAILQPGETYVLADGRSLRVVDAVADAAGRCEFLAVAPLAAGSTPGEEPGENAAGAVLDCESLPLPYTLPE